MGAMDVVVSPEARALAARRGGVVFVRSHSHRCCSGPLTLLDTSTEEPADAGDYVTVSEDGPGADRVTVRYRGRTQDGPHVLTVAVQGRLRRRLVSYWDGCAFRLDPG
jgi:hypothetical protein